MWVTRQTTTFSAITLQLLVYNTSPVVTTKENLLDQNNSCHCFIIMFPAIHVFDMFLLSPSQQSGFEQLLNFKTDWPENWQACTLVQYVLSSLFYFFFYLFFNDLMGQRSNNLKTCTVAFFFFFKYLRRCIAYRYLSTNPINWQNRFVIWAISTIL